MTNAPVLIPDRGYYELSESPIIHIRGEHGGGPLTLSRLHHPVRVFEVPPHSEAVELGALEAGGYGVDFAAARTAFDVVQAGHQPLRYAFVAQLDDDVRVTKNVEFLRRVHATHVQYYDWAYRHDQLVSPTDTYRDPLGLARSLPAMRELVKNLHAAGIASLGYAAVYAVPAIAEHEWRDSLMYRQDGVPYRLGESFLSLTDPGDSTWLEYFYRQLREAMMATGMDGFHLDAYGWPKFALRRDGSLIDLAAELARLVDGVRDAVPGAWYMFNNVNDFPTESTARARQDATYIEVWSPHDTYDDLAALIARARFSAPDRPVVLSAYLSHYSTDDPSESLQSAKLLTATAQSSGGSTLLLGEDGHLLTGPYYADNHELSPEHLEELVAWSDFVVSMAELLHDPDAVDVSERFAGGINHDVDVILPDGRRAVTKATPGELWLRVVRVTGGMVIHLIDLTAQTDAVWDSAKRTSAPQAGVRVVLSGLRARASMHFCSPSQPTMTPIEVGGSVSFDQENALSAAEGGAVFELPPIDSWGVIFVPWECWSATGLKR